MTTRTKTRTTATTRRRVSPRRPVGSSPIIPKPILTIDQSYSNTGFAIISDDQHKYAGQATFWTNLSFSARCSHREHRKGMRETLSKILRDHHPKTVVIERVRLHRNGRLSLNAALALATISGCIIDTVYEFDSSIQVYQLDTMDWKRTMLRTPAERTGKQGTMDLIAALIGSPINDNDVCDALAMGFCSYQHPHLLKLTTI